MWIITKICLVSGTCYRAYVSYLQTTDRCGHVFEHEQCQGRMLSIPGGIQRPYLGVFNDVISSIVVKSRCMLTVYEHTYFKGSSKTYREGKHGSLRGFIFAGSWNDAISSYRCHCVKYPTGGGSLDEAAIRGPRTSTEICPLIPPKRGLHSNGAEFASNGGRKSSIQDEEVKCASFHHVCVRRGCELTIYDEADFKGSTSTYCAGVHCHLKRQWSMGGWHDAFSSYACRCDGVKQRQQPSQRAEQTICDVVNILVGDLTPEGREEVIELMGQRELCATFHGVEVREGCKLTVYDTPFYQGRRRTYGPGGHCDFTGDLAGFWTTGNWSDSTASYRCRCGVRQDGPDAQTGKEGCGERSDDDTA